MKRFNILGLLWVAWKFVEYVTYDFDNLGIVLAIIELPLMIWWFVECVKYLNSKDKFDKNKTGAWVQTCIAGTFILLWLIFFAMGVLLSIGEL